MEFLLKPGLYTSNIMKILQTINKSNIKLYWIIPIKEYMKLSYRKISKIKLAAKLMSSINVSDFFLFDGSQLMCSGTRSKRTTLFPTVSSVHNTASLEDYL